MGVSSVVNKSASSQSSEFGCRFVLFCFVSWFVCLDLGEEFSDRLWGAALETCGPCK